MPLVQVACKEVPCTAVNPVMHVALHVLPDAVVVEQFHVAFCGRPVMLGVLEQGLAGVTQHWSLACWMVKLLMEVLLLPTTVPGLHVTAAHVALAAYS